MGGIEGANPTILANSQIESGFQTTSSCITCHARAAIGPRLPEETDQANRLSIFKSITFSPMGGVNLVGNVGPSRNLIEAVLVSMILLGLMCTSAFFVRSWRMQKMADHLEADKARLAAELFPDEPNIRSPERLLQTEFDRLTRIASDDEQFSQRVSALPMLCRFLEAYPASAGIEIASIQILLDRATVTGSVVSLDRLDFLSQSLQAKGMRVEQIRYSLGFEIQLESVEGESPMTLSKEGR